MLWLKLAADLNERGRFFLPRSILRGISKSKSSCEKNYRKTLFGVYSYFFHIIYKHCSHISVEYNYPNADKIMCTLEEIPRMLIDAYDRFPMHDLCI